MEIQEKLDAIVAYRAAFMDHEKVKAMAEHVHTLLPAEGQAPTGNLTLQLSADGGLQIMTSGSTERPIYEWMQKLDYTHVHTLLLGVVERLVAERSAQLEAEGIELGVIAAPEA